MICHLSILLEIATLEYIQLGQATHPGVNRVFLPVQNDINSEPIAIPNGFAIGTYKATTAYVSYLKDYVCIYLQSV